MSVTAPPPNYPSSTQTQSPHPDSKTSYTELYLNKLRQQPVPFQSLLPSAVQSTKDSFVRDLTLLNKTVNPSPSSTTN
jgi:hypothetical protein